MPGREATVIACVLVLIWAPTVPVPARAVAAVSAIASGSLFVYLTHFAVYPHVMPLSSALAVVASLVVGLAYWKLWTQLGGLATRARSGLRSARTRLAPPRGA
jgi:hypothetical protein